MKVGNKRKILKLIKEEIKSDIPESIKKIIRGKNKVSSDYFTQKNKIYLASADQFIGMKKIVEGENVLQCKHFFSVIGGLGGLNILSRLKNLKTITFFDINPFELFVGKFYLEIIKNSRNREDFVSLIYLRQFDSSKYSFLNQEDFYSLPLDENLKKRLKKILSKELYSFYIEAYLPHIKNPSKDTYEGISDHCTQLLLFHEAPLEEPLSHPFSSRKNLMKKRISSINSFFFGKGWLKTEERFQQVKKNLKECKINFIIKDIFDLNAIPSSSGLYSSNVFSGKEKDFPSFAYKFDWILWYSKKTERLNLEYEIFGERLIPFKKTYGEGIFNPHKSCCDLLDDHFELNKMDFLEVIQPHLREGMDFGFKHYVGQKKISVDNFLDKDLKKEQLPQIIGIHILMANGCSPEKWKKVIRKALGFGKEIFIFEHRKNCGDFPEWDVDEEKILPEKEIDKFLLSLNTNWEKFGAANKFGNELDIRNICWILKNEKM